MSTGKTHAVVGAISCLITWGILLLITWNFSIVGLICALIFGRIFAKYPDEDRDVKHLWGGGHRNSIYHSAIIPGIILVLILIPAIGCREYVIMYGSEAWSWRLQSFATMYNIAVSLPIYWCVAHGSHLIMDCGGKEPTGMTHVLGKIYLVINGVILILAGFFAGMYVLV